ncbi:sugar transferase [Sphingomonas oryzagri]|uniref:Sugar transferase n=1 Tax=Sphingomonas oryzagri TaxID=3042314 RepID=A0ABT6N1Q2_9SPHN|nr:sugar transferase [Sphingomonas oryzagri]MDH7639185.1 sugar transferase [Sphingomonas oryzagri]
MSENNPDAYDTVLIQALPPSRWDECAAAAAVSPLKRGLDFAIALAALLVALPILAVAAILIRASSDGPILFRQTRTGLHGTPFQILKFRTMYVTEDGDAIRHATRRDSRVTPVGAFLRATSIDELPQLINVLLGDMSLVGPRPHAVAHDRLYGTLLQDYARRFAVKPGITGLAQIRGLRGEIHGLSCMERRVRADCEYIERWSVGADIGILCRTLPLMVRDTHAY